MTRTITCAICKARKPRRLCPAVHEEICTVCCATGREETIDCPLDCEYLREAHRHEKVAALDISAMPNQDVKISEEFIVENEILLALMAVAVYEGAVETSATTDQDVREALESLVGSYRAMQSGLVVETLPANPYAAAVVTHVKSSIEEIRREEQERTGSTTIRDATLLAVLAFLQRLEYSHNNGRKRCRAFIDFLRGFCLPAEPEPVIL